MTNEQILLSVGLPILALILGYLAAIVLGRKQQSALQQQLIELKAKNGQVNESLEKLSATHDSVVSQLRKVELEQEGLKANLQSESSRKEELENELSATKENAEETLRAKHIAEKATESAKAELQESRSQQQDVQSRLAAANEELKTEREVIAQLKDEKADIGQQAKGFEVQAKETQQKLEEVKASLAGSEEKLAGLQDKCDSLNREYTELKTTQDEREASHAREVASFEKQKEDLKTEFKVVSEEIIKQRQEALSEQNKVGVGALLKPLQEQINSFQQRVNEVHTESIKGNTNLESEIKKVLDVGLKMRDEASNLTSALKGDSQKRGAWGEAQLERTLEMSGLIEDAHYEKQSSFKDTEGKQKQTDYLIKLPDNKHIIIDSKVQLVAYDKAIAAETPEEEALALDEHVKAVKSNIDDLVKKDYTNLIGMRSPSFVLMFIPIEPAYIDALKNNKDLFNYGYDKGIVLVSHTTLIPILRTVANLWMMEQSNQEAREISEKAGDIYNQVCTVAERLQKVGTSLKAVSNNYNNTVTSLVGQQGLHGKVERFNQLSSKVSKSMPALEPSHIDFDTERLALAAEPIEDKPIQDDPDTDEVDAVPAISHQDAVTEEK